MISKFTAWFNSPAPARKKGWVIVSAFLDGVANQLRDSKISALEKRIEALEGKRA